MSNPDWTTLFDRPGFQAKLAKRFNLSRQTVNGWRSGIPIPYCAGVEHECAGEFTRRDFRPDDWKQIWPELERRQGSERSDEAAV
jgi:DNA-binding transcriptional regulator YdaS (Cro superfamily)